MVLGREAPYCDISSSFCIHGSYTHLHGHAENGGSKNSGTYMYDSNSRSGYNQLGQTQSLKLVKRLDLMAM